MLESKILTQPPTIRLEIIPCHKDNYSYLFFVSEKKCVVIDACELGPLDDYFEMHQVQPVAILTTHHHWDHVGGNIELQKKYNCPIYGSHLDVARIPGIDNPISSNEQFTLQGFPIQTLFVPGHTHFHVAYFFPQQKYLFSGDSFFSCGCGRIFEGTYEQMYETLNQFQQLPPDTLLFCGHEYSQKNIEFALQFEPANKDLLNRKKSIEELLALNHPTVPTTLELERKINPFLRSHSSIIKTALKNPHLSDFETFVALRKNRDIF